MKTEKKISEIFDYLVAHPEFHEDIKCCEFKGLEVFGIHIHKNDRTKDVLRELHFDTTHTDFLINEMYCPSYLRRNEYEKIVRLLYRRTVLGKDK